MTFWFTPFPLSSSLDAKLHSAGLRQHPGSLAGLAPGSLVLYASPHEALEALRGRDPLAPSPEELLACYQALLQAASAHRLVSSWRLQQLSAQQISAWLALDALPVPEVSPPMGDGGLRSLPLEPWSTALPLTALVARVILDQCPACLDAYLQLEHQAERFGTSPDTGYGLRLASTVDVGAVLDQWWQAESSSNLTMLQLQQVEEEMLSLFLANRRQGQTLALMRRQVTTLLRLVERQLVLLSRCVRP